MAHAKAKGRRLGRSRLYVDTAAVEARRAKGESLRAIARDLGVSPALLVLIPPKVCFFKLSICSAMRRLSLRTSLTLRLARSMSGKPSYIERLNATTRLQMRCLTRLTLAFSKKLENFEVAVALHFA